MSAVSEGCANTMEIWDGREIFLGKAGAIIMTEKVTFELSLRSSPGT